MLRPCPEVAPFCPDDPLGNYSSEADDSLDFLSTRFAGSPPLLLKDWTATACGRTFVSRISQLDADMQAEAAAQLCLINAECPGCIILFNLPQTGCVPCPDGSQCCLTISGGIFPGANQDQADQAALDFANAEAFLNRICYTSDVPSSICIGANYTANFTATTVANWTITGGSLPPGLHLVPSGVTMKITGIPNTTGQFGFKIRATNVSSGTFSEKVFAIFVASCCSDILINSSDTANVVSWTTPAKFAHRYAMHLALGEMNTFQVKLPASVPNAADLVQLYTSGGVVATSGQARFLAGTQATDQNRFLQIWVYGITPGDYLLEITVPVSGTVMTRESNDFTSQSITTTVASPRTHDGLNNFASVFDFNWKSGDCFALWAGHVGSAPYMTVYDSSFNVVPITTNSSFSSLTDDHFIVIPSNGLYHVEVALAGAATGQLLFAVCCAVRGDFTVNNCPKTNTLPFQPIASVTLSGQPTSFTWGFSRELFPLAPAITFTVKATGISQIPCPDLQPSDLADTTKVWLMAWRAGIVAIKNHFVVEKSNLAVAPFINPWPPVGSNLNYQVTYTVTADGWSDVATGTVTLINADTNAVLGTGTLVPAPIVGFAGRANCVISPTMAAENIYNIKAMWGGDARYFPVTAPTVQSWVPALEIQINNIAGLTVPWGGIMVFEQYINPVLEFTPHFRYKPLNPPAGFLGEFHVNYDTLFASKWLLQLTNPGHSTLNYQKDDPQLGSPTGSYPTGTGATITPIP